MGVGPPGRTGRDQMSAVREFLAAPERRPGEAIVVCCQQGAGRLAATVIAAGGVPYPVDCAGNLHTSVIERLVRGGAGGVLVLACPSRDCWHREGARWLVERVDHGREAELQPRVDRARVALSHASASERSRVTHLVRGFAQRIATLGDAAIEDPTETEAACEAAFAGPGS
jgi:coenzyme F420-reducing hydrogenase delta subunit